MMGRNTPSRGLEMTASYIAQQFRAAGLEPGGDKGTFLQRYIVSQGRSQTAGSTGRSKIVEPPVTAPNVVGIVEGTDSMLKHEYVVFSAHMDHVGVDAASSPDSIWNGADDDASGTAAVIELAKAFSEDRPRRSLIFLTVSGEEKGLLGSRWFAEHPPVPIQQIVADLNMDMIGRNWRDTIVAIGREHSDLGATLHRVNAAHPELRMTAIGDLWPQENFYFRSDHFNFARRGVPILFFFNGVHADYHRPSDSAEKIDYEKESRIVRLVFYLGQAIANHSDRPKWNAESYQRIVKGATKP
jgi:Zn-dependent M28 family amino/carboxypeptidase